MNSLISFLQNGGITGVLGIDCVLILGIVLGIIFGVIYGISSIVDLYFYIGRKIFVKKMKKLNAKLRERGIYLN